MTSNRYHIADCTHCKGSFKLQNNSPSEPQTERRHTRPTGFPSSGKVLLGSSSSSTLPAGDIKGPCFSRCEERGCGKWVFSVTSVWVYFYMEIVQGNGICGEHVRICTTHTKKQTNKKTSRQRHGKTRLPSLCQFSGRKAKKCLPFLH